MLMTDKGHIVTVASMAGHGGMPGLTDYCASKFAAVGFDESLRLELKVTSNCLHEPSWIYDVSHMESSLLFATTLQRLVIQMHVLCINIGRINILYVPLKFRNIYRAQARPPSRPHVCALFSSARECLPERSQGKNIV